MHTYICSLTTRTPILACNRTDRAGGGHWPQHRLAQVSYDQWNAQMRSATRRAANTERL
jgi:hypothetical protein